MVEMLKKCQERISDNCQRRRNTYPTHDKYVSFCFFNVILKTTFAHLLPPASVFRTIRAYRFDSKEQEHGVFVTLQQGPFSFLTTVALLSNHRLALITSKAGFIIHDR